MSPAAADTTVDPIDRNASCRQLLDNPTAYEIKIETAGINNGAQYGPITFKDVNAGKTLMGFDSTAPIDAVFVKGGTGGGGTLYSYDPPVTTDTNMGVAGYGKGTQQISHVSFCWNEPPVVRNALSATKTANGTYDRDITWELEKSADPTELTGAAGGSAGSSTWSVLATKTVVEDNFLVAGEIVVTNPNTIPVDFSVTDMLDDGTVATVQCPSSTVAANASVTCTYSAEPDDADAERNNATVTSLTMGVPGATAQADIDWVAAVTGDEEVTLTDERLAYEELIDDTTPIEEAEEFLCPADPSVYTDGSWTETYTNVATLVGENTDLTADADVTVTCTLAPLEV
ncbi:MAG: hypothetical protein H5T80_10570, partial [Dietzia sp.]|nr:hypothetical protein [Dietzia sp.]